MIDVLILVLIFIATWTGIVGAWLLIEQRRLTTRDRLAALMGIDESELNDGNEAAASLLDPLFRGSQRLEQLKLELWRAGLTIKPTDFLAAIGLSGVVCAGLVGYISRHPILTLLAGVIGLLAPTIFLKAKQTQRRAKLEAQLPDAMAALSSSLRSGYSFLQALQLVAKEGQAPLSQEVQRVLDEIGVGVQTDAALGRMVERVQSYDMDLMVTAIAIQYQVGGNLAELLDTIGETVRQRFHTRNEIKGLTAEGRLSGSILFFLPIVLMVVLSARSPDYMKPLFETEIGRTMLIGAFAMQVVGGLIIQKLLKVDA
jgi:tight adherence protein B